MQEVLHGGEQRRVVSDGAECQAAQTEGFGHGIRHIVAAEIHQDHFAGIAFLKFHGQTACGFGGASVDGCIGHQRTPAFRLVAAPFVVESPVAGEVAVKQRTMQRCNGAELQAGEFLHERLHIGAVFPHYVAVIAACLIGPRFIGLRHGERAERVGREQDAVGLVERHHYLRPVHHRSGDEPQGGAAKRQRVAVGHRNAPFREVYSVKKVVEHGHRFGRGHHLCLRIPLKHGPDAARVVGLHVLDYQIGGRAAAEGVGQTCQPVGAATDVHGVHHGDLLVVNQI